jgi:hypothetical protein
VNENCQDMDPIDISLFYGTTRALDVCGKCRSGAGNPIDEESDGESDWNDFDSESHFSDTSTTSDSSSDLGSNSESTSSAALDDAATSDDEISRNLYSKAVKVPEALDPLPTLEAHKLFHNLLEHTIQTHHIPQGFGVLPEEWLNGYPTTQEITTGRWGQKKLTISLPAEVWLP